MGHVMRLGGYGLKKMKVHKTKCVPSKIEPGLKKTIDLLMQTLFIYFYFHKDEREYQRFWSQFQFYIMQL